MRGFSRVLRRIHVLLAVAALMPLAPGGAPQAQAAADTMVLIRKFSGTRFTTAGVEGKVAGFAGLTPEFKSVLAKHPEALRAADRAQMYSVVQLLGTVGVTLGAALALKQTLDQADDPLGAESNSTPLVVVAGSGAVTLVGLFGGRHHLTKAVRLFNEGQRSTGRGGPAALLGSARLGFGIGRGDRSPRANVGIVLPFPALPP